MRLFHEFLSSLASLKIDLHHVSLAGNSLDGTRESSASPWEMRKDSVMSVGYTYAWSSNDKPERNHPPGVVGSEVNPQLANAALEMRQRACGILPYRGRTVSQKGSNRDVEL